MAAALLLGAGAILVNQAAISGVSSCAHSTTGARPLAVALPPRPPHQRGPWRCSWGRSSSRAPRMVRPCRQRGRVVATLSVPPRKALTRRNAATATSSAPRADAGDGPTPAPTATSPPSSTRSPWRETFLPPPQPHRERHDTALRRGRPADGYAVRNPRALPVVRSTRSRTGRQAGRRRHLPRRRRPRARKPAQAPGLGTPRRTAPRCSRPRWRRQGSCTGRSGPLGQRHHRAGPLDGDRPPARLGDDGRRGPHRPRVQSGARSAAQQDPGPRGTARTSAAARKAVRWAWSGTGLRSAAAAGRWRPCPSSPWRPAWPRRSARDRARDRQIGAGVALGRLGHQLPSLAARASANEAGSPRRAMILPLHAEVGAGRARRPRAPRRPAPGRGPRPGRRRSSRRCPG